MNLCSSFDEIWIESGTKIVLYFLVPKGGKTLLITLRSQGEEVPAGVKIYGKKTI